MKKDNTVYLRHILDAIHRIETYIEGITYENFIDNNLVQSAVIREIEIIGEATKNLAGEFSDKYPNIPWRKMVGMRDKLIHDYLGVDLDAVWDTIEKDIPALKNKLRNFIEKKARR